MTPKQVQDLQNLIDAGLDTRRAWSQEFLATLDTYLVSLDTEYDRQANLDSVQERAQHIDSIEGTCDDCGEE